MSSSTQDQPRPRKRHRIAESCKLCRSKKTRCDGRRPTCSSCQSKNTACEYNEPNVVLSSDILSKMADLEARVQALESLPSNFTGSFHVATGTPSPLPRHGNAQSSIVDNPTLRFISSVTQTAPTGGSDIQTQPGNPNDRATSFAGMNMSQVVLPSREVADDFIECYERLVYPMFPVLHMPSFKARYLRVWESPSNDQALDTTFAASLNIVFALGCLNSSNTEPSLILSTAETFYERSRSILPLDSLDRPSIEVVQYLLLTGNYLSFTKYSHRYCNTLAMAIQVAQTIDLHRADHDTTSQLQREMGRRVWHLCLTMQRYLFFCRALAPLSASDDEYLLEEGEGCQPAATPSLLDALAVSMKIFDVVAGVREVNAASFSKALQMPELMKILQLNERLTEIEDNLPEHLKYKSGQAASSAREKVIHYQAEAALCQITSPAHKSPSSSPSGVGTSISKHLTVTPRTRSSQRSMAHLHTECGNFTGHPTHKPAVVFKASSALPRDPADPPPSHADSITKAFEILDAHQWRAEGVSETRTKLCKFLQTVENENRDPEYEASTSALCVSSHPSHSLVANMPQLNVPGAVLHYETFGSDGPLLIVIPGADGRGSVFHSSAQFLAAHFTVVCWDRRGYSQSFLDGKQDFQQRLQTDADDAQRLIVHLSRTGTAAVFGTSSGAVVAQQLLASHPECVTTLIAHEPPAFSVLPEELQLQAHGLINHIYDTYRAHGPSTAMEVFSAGLSKGPETSLMQSCMDAKRGDDIRANSLFWFEFELRQYTSAPVDVEALSNVKEKLILAVGEDSGDGPAMGVMKALAMHTDKEVLRIPGGHLGYVLKPEMWAKRILELLQ
ncbi:unnamed protein product [Fusarium fujikuroi]|nr:unnamed protein product [Fusarium fujikuroi]VZI14884.1 unnamed protein product [Fusarium fujikuroi]